MRAATGISDLGAACSVGSSLIRSSCRTVTGLCQSVLVEAQLMKETMRIKALTIVAGHDVNAQTRGPQVATTMKTGVAGVDDKGWKVRTVELAPGAANAPHFYSGVELVYVLEGAGLLEVEGGPFVTLHSGAVAAVSPKQRHLLKNARQTQPLKVLSVLLREKAQSDLELTTRVPNVNSKPSNAVEQDNSAVPGLVF
jgi:quercetin dioxygenase-like cupin family protein